jgi:hypothetical protein
MNKRVVRVSLPLGVFSAVMLALSSGCTSLMPPPVSPDAARQLTSKTYDVSYDKLFQSVFTSLQDSGYTITQGDKNSGLILANYEKMCTGLGDVFIGRYSSRQEVSATVRKIGEAQQELRLQIRCVDKFKDARHSWEDVMRTTPLVYKTVFDRITAEVEGSKSPVGSQTPQSTSAFGTASPASSQVKEPSATDKSTADRLKELATLKAQGVITEEEYEQKRNAILSTL